MKQRISVSAGFLVGLYCITAHAYEDDVHYGLTKWLALQATFTESQADSLAHHTNWIDHSVLTAPFMVAVHMCLRPDPAGSRQVQRIHFPGPGKVPGNAKHRQVAPSSAEARRALDNEMARPASNLDVGIANFGDGLHPFEDSWAHQGIPDTPWPWLCDPELSWGHPVARGGWRSHDADLTYLDPKSTLDMAKGTYQQLCAYAKSVLKRECEADFESLIPAIRAFSRAQTKEQKRAWFTAHKFRDTRFLKHTSLPRGERYRAEFETTLTALSRKSALGATEEDHFMLAFLEQWMTSNSHESLVKEMVDHRQFQYPFGEGDGIGPDLIAPLLSLWRVREHGDATAALHGREGLSKKALYTALDRSKDVNFPYKNVEEALIPIDADGRPLVVRWFKRDGVEYIVGTARLRHAPYEAVAVIARKIDDRYRVVGISSFVDR